MPKSVVGILLLMLIQFLCPAQKKDLIRIQDPVIDTALTQYFSFKLAAPQYLLNKDYFVYQKNDSTRQLIKADMPTFRFPGHGNIRGLFALDKNGVYFNGNFIKTNPEGFTTVGEVNNKDGLAEKKYYWKTATKLFLNTTRIKKAVHIPSFTAATYGTDFYFKDKNHLYYQGKTIRGADSRSASESFGAMIYDKNYVYIDGKIAMYNKDTLRSVNDYLVKTSTLVLKRETYEIQSGIDAKTIHPLSRYYAMDKDHVYYGNTITPITPENSKNVKVWNQANNAYVTDGLHVYTGADVLIPEFDAKTFGLLFYQNYCFDKTGIYEKKWSDKENTVIYKKLPFYYTNAVSDKNSFTCSIYIIYENQAYDALQGKLYKNLSPQQIDLAKDNKLSISVIDDTLTETKTFDAYWFYKTNNKVYINNKETTADAQTFEQISPWYYKDKNHVYEYTRGMGLIPFDSIDVQSVTIFNYFLADKNYVYINHYRAIKNDHVELLAAFNGSGWLTPDSYLFKNTEGYWLVFISNVTKVKYMGQELDGSWKNFTTSKE